MKPIIYRTRLGQAKSVPLPDDIRHLLDKDADIEVTIRKIRPKHDDMRTTDQVLGEIQEKMDKDFPNLRKPFDPELSAIAGISGDMEEAVSKYGGREIMGMARIEKYLEKGETIETLS